MTISPTRFAWVSYSFHALMYAFCSEAVAPRKESAIVVPSATPA